MRRIPLLLVLIMALGTARAQLSVMSESSAICAGQSIWLKATGADVYAWQPATNLDTNATDSVNFSTMVASSYSLTVYGYDTVLMDTDTVMITITVSPLPVINIISSAAGNNNFVCLGNSATLTASGSAGIVSYAWSPDSSLNNDTAMVVTATPTASTTYSLTVTDTNGCVNTAVKQVSVNSSKPTIGLTASDSIICPGGSSTLSATAAGASFAWSPSGSLSSSTGSPVTASPTTTTTYTVTATLNGCDTTRSITIEVMPTPALSYTQTPTSSVCLDEDVFFQVDCAECLYYEWVLPNSNLQTTSDTINISLNEPGVSQVTLKGFGANGCSSNEVIAIAVDSCYVDTPFGIANRGEGLSRVYSDGPRLVVSGPAPVEAVSIYTLTGQEVVRHAAGNARNVAIDTERLGAGVYIVVVRAAEAVESHKVMLR